MRIKKVFFINVLLIFVLILSLYSTIVKANQTDSQKQDYSQISQNTDNDSAGNNINIYAKSCILIERSTGRVAYEKNADEKMYPASTTKLLTAIIALEHCDLTDIVTITPDMISQIPPGYVSAYLSIGEKVTIDELLNILLIPSANDAGFALAIHISGSIDEFAKLMNEKAKQIGCENTNFTNPSGIHNTNHFSTARDIAKIGVCASNYPHIMDIVCKTNYTLHENQFNARSFITTNTLIIKSEKNYYEFANGMKTGFTDQAGSCIVATAQKENMQFLAVILGAPEPDGDITYRDVDCKTLFEYGFTNYDEITKTDTHISQFFNLIISEKSPIVIIFYSSLISLTIVLILILLGFTRKKKR